jgi:cytochrome c553
VKIVLVLVGLLFFSAQLCSAGDFGYRTYNDNALIIKEKRVEFDYRVFSGSDGYYALGDSLKQEYNENVEKELIETKAQLDLALKLLHKKKMMPPKEDETPTDDGETSVDEMPVPAEPESTPSQYTELDKKVYAIFRADCSSCHGTNPVNNSLSLINKDGLPELTLASRNRIHDRVNNVGLAERGLAKMPKGNKTLGDEDVEAIRLWVQELAAKQE